MSLRARIDRLTTHYGDRRPCPECGAERGAPIEMAFDDGAEPYTGPDRCPGCGRVLCMTFTIDTPNTRGAEEWDDDAQLDQSP